VRVFDEVWNKQNPDIADELIAAKAWAKASADSNLPWLEKKKKAAQTSCPGPDP